MCKRLSSGVRLFAGVAALAFIVGELVHDVGAQNITVPNTFVNGTVADATQVNANFAALAANALNRNGGTLAGDTNPDADDTRSLGTNALRFANIRAHHFAGTSADFTGAHIGDGSALTSLSATQLTSGTLPIARLPYTTNDYVDGRCTLTTVTPVTTADVTAATSVLYTPYRGNRISLFDGSATWNTRTFSELSVSLGSDAANTNYDLFVFDNSGTPAVERLAWTNDTTRATGLVLQDGVLVKSGATTRRYACTYRTTGTVGQTEDSFAKRFVWNYYNRVRRVLRVKDTTDSWTYTTATYRQANAATANQLAVVIGVAEVGLEAGVSGNFSNTLTGVSGDVSIGEDSTTTPATGVFTSFGQTGAAGQIMPTTAVLRTYPAVGYHFYAWLELSTASGTTTWFGDNGGSITQTGIHGSIEG